MHQAGSSHGTVALDMHKGSTSRASGQCLQHHELLSTVPPEGPLAAGSCPPTETQCVHEASQYRTHISRAVYTQINGKHTEFTSQSKEEIIA